MTFDRKAWDETNKEKNRLYSLRHRLRKKGMDLPPETLEQMAAYRAEKKAASKIKDAERKKAWAAANRERKNAKYRERYHNDPEFRASEIAKRASKLPRLSDEEKAARREQRLKARKRERQEKVLKARKEDNAKRHAAAVARAERIIPRQSAPAPRVPTFKVKKPGRLCALMGWRGY